ncbi:MAG: hypothetical protein M3373_02525 [Gemmatimonadota bacterium]|nr:hypothetical protein [Gemmatimonadota bacterium]
MPSDLKDLLRSTLAGERPHVEKLTIAAAIVSEVLRQHGMEATLVGGGAIEFHASEVYTTSDIDLVVEGRSRDDLDAALSEFGFTRRGRHWVLRELLVEVPGNWMSDPTEVVAVGPLALRVVRKEVVLADRIVGFKHWRATAYGAQAIAMLALFGGRLDERLLVDRVRSEGAEDALIILRELAADEKEVGEEQLRSALAQLHPQSSQADGDATR